jgi:cutinase
MRTVTPMFVRMSRLIVRAAASTIFVALVLTAMFAGLYGAPPSAKAAGDSCPAVEVVFARGTNEAPGVGATGQSFVDALTARLPGRTVDVYGVGYPASMDFGRAVDGIVDASNKIQSIAASCPSTQIVLGGYSQGAAVAAYTTTDAVPGGFDLPAGITGPMPPAVAPHVAAVVLFGTPDAWIMNLLDRGAPPITIGHSYVAKTLQLCATGDPVCFPGGLDRSAHSFYKTNGMAEQAADFAAHQLGARVPAATVQKTAGQIGTTQPAGQPASIPASELDPPIGN